MKKILVVCVALMLTVLSACVVAPKAHQRPLFPAAEYASFRSAGSAKIEVTGSYETRISLTESEARSMVYSAFILPATSYSKFAYDQSYRWNYNVEPANLEEKQFWRFKEKSKFANFTFDNVPAGEWYVFLRVDWSQFGGPLSRLRGKKVHVAPDGVTSVDVTLPKGAQEGQNLSFLN